MSESASWALHAATALLPGGLQSDVRVRVEGGVISAVDVGVGPQPGDERCEFLVPAMANLHSHAFQRAMAGLAEMRGPGTDSFWSWRNVMYETALSLDPDDVEAIAAQLYMEMLEAGFGRVGEFHYLHHDRDGRPYANPAEMAERIAAAAAATGINLTLLPVFYAHSGFGGAPPSEGQRRFVHTPEQFATLMSGCRALLGEMPGAVLGIAPHSLRAATPEEIIAILPLAEGGPVHIHVAEQVKEVEDCIAYCGARPIQFLLSEAPVDGRWCLIHATHMDRGETRAMAASGAIAGLCPITEANLGDGIFSIRPFLEAGGRYGVGSDSNVLISVTGELRQLEYSARLGLRERNVIAEPNGSTGLNLYARALTGGAAALGVRGGIEGGHAADLVALDVDALSYLPAEHSLDHWIFAGGASVDRVWIAGRRRVEAGRHLERDAIASRFTSAMKRLREA